MANFLLNMNLVISNEKTNNKNIEKGIKAKSEKKVGRNDPCPLGCGIKYKKCGIDKKCKKISETN